MGLGMLLFVAQFLDFLCTTMATLVLIALVHGVYITRPCVPVGSEERTALLQVTGGFASTYLFSTLACGFKVDGLLSPFGVLRGPASWPYILARACTGVFCFNRGMKLANEDSSGDKKRLILRRAAAGRVAPGAIRGVHNLAARLAYGGLLGTGGASTMAEYALIPWVDHRQRRGEGRIGGLTQASLPREPSARLPELDVPASQSPAESEETSVGLRSTDLEAKAFNKLSGQRMGEGA
ncbi:unnamed protein product [Prorocentrum cordatum]|uniref:Uncharacterized protein n=1 Tax=Prorocentrum cordatum TaxID=2364126 RepID=A0ABN9RRB1_9DINO|nr:unnamed protein product [Polarella glacialis]